jgi:hypothetical protein
LNWTNVASRSNKINLAWALRFYQEKRAASPDFRIPTVEIIILLVLALFLSMLLENVGNFTVVLEEQTGMVELASMCVVCSKFI